jgi:hypothetical protein
MNTEGTGFCTCKACHRTESLKIILLQPTRKETIGRPKKRWRQNGPNCPTLDDYDDDVFFSKMCLENSMFFYNMTIITVF